MQASSTYYASRKIRTIIHLARQLEKVEILFCLHGRGKKQEFISIVNLLN